MNYGLIILGIIAISMIGILGAPSQVNFTGLRNKAEAGALAIYADGLLIAKNNYEMTKQQPLPLADWQQALRDAEQPIPNPPGMTLSYGRQTGEGNYFCFTHDHISQLGYERLVKSQQKLTSRTYVNEFCGANTNMAPSDVTSASGLALTVYTGD